ncbi:hypothetical protein E4T43_06520 [Aureobasidium subglaciale]|nr:hypothetical protein E4T43_06520 [Aureobasidium subglaciale]
MNPWGTAYQHFVQPTCQGKGYGSALFEAVLQEFKSKNTSIIGLDAVVEQKTTYERRGFVESPLGKLRCMSWNISTNIDHGTSHDLDTNLRLIDIKDVPYHLLAESDLDHTYFKRKRLWGEKFFSRSDVFGLALLGGEGATKTADIRAWTVVREVPQGYRLGPVYATDQESARRIVLASMEHAMGRIENTSTNSSRRSESPYNNGGDLGWQSSCGRAFRKAGVELSRCGLPSLRIEGKATPQQDKGGLAHSGMYAILDAAIG